MATMVCLGREGVEARLVDRSGVTGGAYRHIHGGLTMTSPTRYTQLPGLELRTVGEYVTTGEYREYLERYAAHHRLEVTGAEVVQVVKEAGRFSVRFAGGEREEYEALVVATGMYDFPVSPEIPGLGPAGPRVMHAHDWPGPGPFAGLRVLVVGGATSAVELAEHLATTAAAVTVSCRGEKIKISRQRFLGRDLHDYAYLFKGLPRWLLGSYCDRRPTLPATDRGFNDLVRAGRITVRTEVTRFEGRDAIFARGPRESCDAVLLATGYRFEAPFLPGDVARAPGSGHLLADDCESRSWRGLFVIGAPCARGLASEFLHGIAGDAALLARRVRELLEIAPS